MAAKTFNALVLRKFTPCSLIRYSSRVLVRYKKHAYLSKHKDNPFIRHVDAAYKKSVITSWYDVFVCSTQDDANPALVFARDVLSRPSPSTINSRFSKNSGDVCKRRFDEFVQNCPQKFGLNRDTLKSKFEFLVDNGIASADAILISIVVPATLDIRSKNAIQVIKILSSIGVDFLHVLCNWPLILATSFLEVKSNLNNLQTLGFSSNEIRELIHEDPCVVAFPLTQNTIVALTEHSKSDLQLFKKSLFERSPQIISNESFASDVKFLMDFGVSPKQLSQNCLPLLNLKTGQLRETINVLMNMPLYMELSRIRDFLIKYPNIIVKLSSIDGRQLLSLLAETINNNNNLYRLLCRSPFLFDDMKTTSSRIVLFKQYGFTDADITKTLLRCVSLYNNDKQLRNLESKLIFLLSHDDVTVADIIQFPSVLRFPISALQCRVGFSRWVNGNLLKRYRLSYKYFSPDKEFVERFCESSLEDYHSFILENNLKLYRVAVF